jgi:hypothetical protein
MSEADYPNRPIFVLGVDRSGTSMVGNLLSAWGAYGGGQAHLCQGDRGNPRGYWEYKPMQEFNHDLLNSTGISIWDTEFKELVKERAADPELRRRVHELSAEMARPGRPWFWKESSLVFSLPFLREIFPRAVYLITLRNPYDSALSYGKLRVPRALQDKVRLIGYSMLRWQYFMLLIFEELKSYRSKLVVPYEALHSSPRDQCARICRFLAATYGMAAASDLTLDRMAQVIDPSLWRNSSGVPLAEAGHASAVQQRLYGYLSSRVDGDVSDFDSSRYPFPDPYWREYCANMSVIQWLLGSL